MNSTPISEKPFLSFQENQDSKEQTSADNKVLNLSEKINNHLEAAKIEAAQNGKETSRYIQNYNLSKEDRFEVAKIAAQDRILSKKLN